MKKVISVILVIVCLISLVACGKPADTAGLWANAKYTKDTELGTGAKTLVVEVTIEEKTVTFTIKTDAETVGAALFEHEIITGEQGDYGLYIKAVNGITADYDVDQSYWAFYANGEYATAGVDTTDIEEGVTYQLVYTK